MPEQDAYDAGALLADDPNDAGAGVYVTAALLRAYSRNDEAEVLRILNGAGSGSIRWACAQLLRLVEQSLRANGMSPGKARMRMRHAAGAVDEQALVETLNSIHINAARLVNAEQGGKP